MHPQFTELTPRWFKRAFIYTGSIGEFRYRFNNDAKENVIHAAVSPNCATSWLRMWQSRIFPGTTTAWRR